MHKNDKRVGNAKVLIDYMKSNGPWNKGKKGVQVAWNKGLTKELDYRVKKYSEIISRSRKGIKLSNEHKKNIGLGLKGRPAPNKGIPCSNETKKKLSNLLSGSRNQFYGKNHSSETKSKISFSRKGKALADKNPRYIGHKLIPFKEKIIKRYLGGESAYEISKSFGVSCVSILNYLGKWGINRRSGYFNFKGKLLCKDGHKVRSYPELLIDNFLYDNGISHEVERSFWFKNKQLKCDFYIPELNLYIEYWGIYHNGNYMQRKRMKLRIYKKANLNLLSIEWNENAIDKLKYMIPICASKQSKLFDF